MLTMSRFTATLAAVAIALTGLTATPAAAQDRDLMRFLAGAAAIAIIAGAASRNRADAQPPRYNQHHRGNARGRHQVLPASCSIQVRNRGRSEQLFNPNCLQRAGFHRLPRQCERQLRTDRGSRTVLSGACLQQAGFRVEAGRRR